MLVFTFLFAILGSVCFGLGLHNVAYFDIWEKIYLEEHGNNEPFANNLMNNNILLIIGIVSLLAAFTLGIIYVVKNKKKEK